MIGFGAPGAYLSQGNRYAQLLQRMPNANNGTVTGGIANVLQQGLMGVALGRDQREQDQARQTMAQALQALQGTPADRITFTEPTRPDGTGEPFTEIPMVPGNSKLAAQLLSSNPYTAQMGYQLTLNDMQNQQQEKLLDKRFQQQKELRAIPQPTSALPAAPIQNFTKRQQLVDQFGENSAEVRTFDNYVRALPFLNAGPAFVQPGIAGSNTTPQVVPKGLNPGDEPAVKGAQAGATETAKLDAKREANFTKAQSALTGFKQQADLVSGTIDKAINLIGPYSTGYGAMLSGLPNTDARALRNYLDTIKANVGFDKLQQMREASPTGGALGQVSDTENRLLQAVNGAMDPMQSGQLKENLESIKTLYQQLLVERQKAFQQDYGNQGGQPNRPKSPSEMTDEELKNALGAQ